MQLSMHLLHETSCRRRIYGGVYYLDIAQLVDGGRVRSHGCKRDHINSVCGERLRMDLQDCSALQFL
jgi:hypothetical protein